MAVKGGDKFNEFFRNFKNKTRQKGQLASGFFSNSVYPDGTKVAQVAFWNEYGTLTKNNKQFIPPRPFFRNVIKAKLKEWSSNFSILLSKYNYDFDKAYSSLGELIRDDIQQSIVQLKNPPNAPATIKIKGKNTPLQDTGDMLRSVDYEYKKHEST